MHITIKTPSRLHLGILDLNGSLGRLYGSIGVALQNPGFVLDVEPAEKLEVCGADKQVMVDLIKKFSTHYKINPMIRIDLTETIPSHVGLGSGTQLALAIATSLSRICRLGTTTQSSTTPDLRELAGVMGRGILSGIGIAAFERGGFVIDGGVSVSDSNVPDPTAPPVVFHHPFPTDWSFVVAVPEVKKGFSGTREQDAFKNAIPAPAEISAEICRIVQMKMLPSLVEKDIETFGSSISEVDKKTGMYFKGVQSGIYGGKITGMLAEFMVNSGSYGAGQSSWGPAVYGLVKEREAEGIENELKEFLAEKEVGGHVFSSGANNVGALIEVRD